MVLFYCHSTIIPHMTRLTLFRDRCYKFSCYCHGVVTQSDLIDSALRAYAQPHPGTTIDLTFSHIIKDGCNVNVRKRNYFLYLVISNTWKVRFSGVIFSELYNWNIIEQLRCTRSYQYIIYLFKRPQMSCFKLIFHLS